MGCNFVVNMLSTERRSNSFLTAVRFLFNSTYPIPYRPIAQRLFNVQVKILTVTTAIHGSEKSSFTHYSSWWVLWYINIFKYAPLGTWRFVLLEYVILRSRHTSVGKSGSCRNDQIFGNPRLLCNSVVVYMSCQLMIIPYFLIYRDNIITYLQTFCFFRPTYITLTPKFFSFLIKIYVSSILTKL